MSDKQNQASRNATLSDIPAIRSFEFDKAAIGNIKSSVNKFRGCVSLPQDFLTLPGRDGLDVKVSAVYTSNIKRLMDTWNLDAPTGILGLGWEMPIEMIAVDKADSASASSDTYYLLIGGTANPMAKTGETSDGKWNFQLRNYQFWQVQFDPVHNVWIIIKENGFISTYGAGSDTASNATQWGVSWGNWIGSSNQRATQTQYPVRWNLASIQTPTGSTVKYQYTSVLQTVMSNGLAYTQASYLSRVIDSYSNSLTFNYREKFGALNPDTTPGRPPVIEYQAASTQQPAPNAYQDHYETRYLDSVDVADATGRTLYGLQFTYDFVNQAPISASNYSLLYKRCLKSVFQYTPTGETLPAMNFDYVDQASRVNPGALKAVTYPAGGTAQFAYKTQMINSPKRTQITNPLSGGIPRVWFGPDYVVFTYCNASTLQLKIQSWNGQWVNQDILIPIGGKSVSPDSVMTLAGENFFALSFRNSVNSRDELYLFRNDDAGQELRFGNWVMYNNAPFLLNLQNLQGIPPGPSVFVAGRDFVIAHNKQYQNGPVQGFSYTWQSGRWNPNGAPPVPSAGDATYAAIAAGQNYYAVSCYLQGTGLKNYVFYRALDGTWNSPNPWTQNGVKVMIDNNQQLYLTVTPLPTGIVLTYVTGTTTTTQTPPSTLINYSLRAFGWNDKFFVLNASSPGTLDLTSPVNHGQAQLEVFRTLVADALVNNNLGLLRNGGGDQSLGNAWVSKLFTTPSPTALVTVAAGPDAAVLCTSTGGSPSTQLATFNPNSAMWTVTGSQPGTYPSISGTYMTLGQYLYHCGTDGSWRQLSTQLGNFNYPQSLQNRGPNFLAYQSAADATATTYVVALKNGGATTLPPLSSAKMYVTSDAPVPGTQLVSGRFLVTYPSSAASFDAAPTLTLYDLDEVNFDAYVSDFPVASVIIEDTYANDQSFTQSFYYGNSSESQVVYNAATGVAQYPLVTVVPGVWDQSATPPALQPQGRSQYYYSNGLAADPSLYPSGGIQNYQNILNGFQLAQKDYDSNGNPVASQFDYWTVYSRDAAGNLLFGAYPRCERSTTSRDGVSVDTRAVYDRTTGVLLQQEQAYCDATGTPKTLRTEMLYAWQVPQYASVFRQKHLYTAIAMSTKSVAPVDGSTRNYVQSQATTYRNWAYSGSVTVLDTPSGDSRLSAYETYNWTTPGATAPQFPAAGQPSTQWQLKTRVLSRTNPENLIQEQVDGSGLVSSFVYDSSQRHLVAKFPNGSLSGDEVSCLGFEAYESDSDWIIGSGGSIVPNPNNTSIDAHTGTRSLSIAASTTGNNGIARTFVPARSGLNYVFSAWVKKPTGFVNTAGNAAWLIAINGQAPYSLAFPDIVGEWTYVSHVISTSGSVEPTQISLQCVNANTRSNVLVDDLRFTPLACPVETYVYNANFRPSAVLAGNGETSRTVYDSLQQPLVCTNGADQISKITHSYFSRAGNLGRFAKGDPNHTLDLGAARGGPLTTFTQGGEWQAVWTPSGNVWQVQDAVLTQTGLNLPGQLNYADANLTNDYALTVDWCVLETPTTPLGIRVGSQVCLQWDPVATQWQLLDAAGASLLPAVDARAFALPSSPFLSELNASTISSNLHAAFASAGYLLPTGSTVAAGAAGANSWTVVCPAATGSYRYALKLNGTAIAVYTMPRHWTLLLGQTELILWSDGKLIFSYTAPSALSGQPQLFFGNRVAISQIAIAVRPQATIRFDDSRGVTIQSQKYAGNQMVVSQTITDSMGRDAVHSKPAFITAARNPCFSYCAGFAALNWSTGTMTGLVASAYPDDQGYPFTRQTFETSPLSRPIEQSVPGAIFRVGGGHTTRCVYGGAVATQGSTTKVYYTKTTTNPNGDILTEFTTLLDQVFYRVSDKDGEEIRNQTIYDDAGNPVQLQSPNYFTPPPNSVPSDWTTVQSFDFANRLIFRQTGSEGPTLFIYDPAGNLRFTQDAEGRKVGTYAYTKYDLLSRPVETGYLTGAWNATQLQTYAGTDPVWPSTPPTWRKQYAYDGTDSEPNSIGRNTEILANNSSSGQADVSESFAYNLLGNTISDVLIVNGYSGGRNNGVDYQYDNIGNITRITYPEASDGSRLEVFYQLNSLNQITAIAASPDFATPLNTFGYDAAGNPVESQIGSGGVVQTYTFNSPYWLTDITSRSQNGTHLFSEALTYTQGGYQGAAYFDGTISSNTLQIGGPGGRQDSFAYSYDSLGQVLNAQNPQNPSRNLGVSLPVSHDANGNFVNLAAGNTPLQFSYFAGTQQLSSVTNTANSQGVAAYQYDANGNALQATEAGLGLIPAHDLNLTYDPALSLPVTVSNSAAPGCSVTFTYGCRQDRVMKQISGGSSPVLKLYIRGTSAMPLMERIVDGATETDVCYVFGPGGLIGMRKAGDWYQILKDHLGSVRGVLDCQGTLVASYEYLTYGALATAQEPEPGFMSYLYTGQEYDAEIGLYNYRSRLYSPSVGRFLGIDAGRQFFSPYLYASNNPVLFIDPTGMFSVGSFFSAIFGVIIGAVEILAGVVVDVVAAVVEAVSFGTATGVAIGLAALSGGFYGAGVSAITYSVFNFDDFSWKDYGVQTLIGAAVGVVTGGLSAAASIGAKSAQVAFTGIADASRSAVVVADEGAGFLATASNAARTVALTGKAYAADAASTVSGWLVNGPVRAGGMGFVKNLAQGVAKSEALGISWNTTKNLAMGRDWDQGLDQVVFSSALSGSIGSLQVKSRLVYGTA